jgi:3'(2'),5'-bisphosphate nucleotidase
MRELGASANIREIDSFCLEPACLTCDPSKLADALYPAVLAAGAAIMSHYDARTAMEEKGDGSPVSAADRDAEDIILAALERLAPGVPVIAEEAASSGKVVDAQDTFFLVDPLDGTREFAARRPEFTVNIALISHGVPIFGMIYAPALSELYWTTGNAAFKALLPVDPPRTLHDLKTERLATAATHPGPQTIVASRSHGSDDLEAWLQSIAVGTRVNIGSSLKFCLVAQGKADLYPRFGPTMEWDTAAGHAIAVAAGGSVTRTDGSAFLYGKAAENYRNPGFIVWSKP